MRFVKAQECDAPVLAKILREVSKDVVDCLLKDLLPGVTSEQILTMVLSDTNSHFSYKNCLLARESTVQGMILAYDAVEHTIPALMRVLIPAERIKKVEPILVRAPEDSFYLNTIWVSQPMRGTGLADQLLFCAELLTTESGRTKLSLFVQHSNHRAIAFYKRHGFRVVSSVCDVAPSFAGDLYVKDL